MLETGKDLTASPHAPEPGSDRLSETQISIEALPKPAAPSSESFCLQDLVRTPTDLDLKPIPSQAHKKLSFSSEKTPDPLGFKFAPIPMCYHSRRRTPILTEVEANKENMGGEGRSSRGIIKQAAQMRHKTVSFSTSLVDGEGKENGSPEDIDMKDSLELQPQVPKDTPSTKASVAVRVDGETASTSLGTGLDEEPVNKAEGQLAGKDQDEHGGKPEEEPVGKADVSYEERVRCNRVSSMEARILPKKSDRSGLVYCAACNRDSRTIVVFEPVPLRTFQQLICCWQDPKRQVMAVHKCVTCKRVIARILQ